MVFNITLKEFVRTACPEKPFADTKYLLAQNSLNLFYDFTEQRLKKPSFRIAFKIMFYCRQSLFLYVCLSVTPNFIPASHY